MLEAKDPAIKLFGKTIPLPEVSEAALTAAAASSAAGDNLDQDEDRVCSTSSSPNSNRGEEIEDDRKDVLGGKTKKEDRVEKEDENIAKQGGETTPRKSANSGTNENADTASYEKESAETKNSKTDEDQSETGNSQEKTLKKPDKILPCPRCNSMDTKFCYYNNYNVNQPRHFCKNCQRYWTAGGTMRNVPVGAGRRKNKNSVTQYRHITVSEAFQHAQAHVPNGLHHPALRPNGTVLTFGSDAPLCESMASALNLADKTMRNCTQNGFHKPEAVKIPENACEQSNGSSAPASVAKNEGAQEQMMQQPCQGFTPQMACFPGAPWPYSWNPAQWNSQMPPPGFCPPGMPMPFYPAAAYWGCTVPGPWGVPWLPQPSSPKQTAPGSGPTSPLGKHSRDESETSVKTNSSGEEESRKENNFWIPKTLRIDDPGEAARSSIWATLGIKHDKSDQLGSGGLFKAFQSKADEKHPVPESSPVLHANPAALSRSVNFRERS